jgi:hypothetical protein
MPPRATAAASTRSPSRTRAASSPRHTRTAKQPRSIAFRAMIESSGPTGQWPHLFLPPEASAYLGKRGAVRVIVRVGAMSFRRAAKPDGDGGHYILFNADMRERTGKEAGDRVMVGLELDLTPQELEVPREFAQMMHADSEADAAFKTMPPSHRRGYLEFIEDAKRPEARARRMEQALRMMRQWAVEKRAKGSTKPRAAKAPARKLARTR